MCIYPTTLWIESEAGGLILQNRYHLNSAGVGFAEDMPAAGLKTQGEYNLKVNINYWISKFCINYFQKGNYAFNISEL